jgi:hypothetical protein
MALNVGTASEMLKEVEARYIRMAQMVDQIITALQKRTAPPVSDAHETARRD